MYRLNILKQRTFDTLLYPPRGISTEAGTTIGVKIIYRSDKAKIPLLNQVSETHSPATILLGDINNQPQIAPHQLLPGPLVVFLDNQFTQQMLFFQAQQ